MTKYKLGLFIALGVLVAALAGWLYGWSGTRPLAREAAAKTLRLHLTEARMKILDARVDVFTANFGNASRNLEHAKGPLQAARAALQSSGPDGAAAKVGEAITRATEAQQLASKFSQDANGRAGQASQLIDEVLQATR
jgi:hypothetical protein